MAAENVNVEAWAAFATTDVRVCHAREWAGADEYVVVHWQVADALSKLGIEGFLADVHLWSPAYCAGATKVVGRAHTVQVRVAVVHVLRFC
jgi:hypothetical protein